ncbi:MAG: magnesium transporter CorA family protein [Patescibacteria group bacterium]
MSHIKKIATNQVTWLNIVNPTKDDIAFLRDEFHFHPINLEDASVNVRAQRPKFDMHDDYLFLVLHFPVYDEAAGRIKAAEVDFFIGKEHLITVHDNSLTPVKDFEKLCLEFDHYREQYLSQNPSVLLYEILDRLLEYCFPILDHMSEDIEHIEDKIFAGEEKKIVKDILQIKRNIANFRKIMQSHNKIIKKLIAMDTAFFPHVDMHQYYNDLVEETKDIWQILETHKETIDALHQTNDASLSYKLNDIMKTLTIFSVVVFPLTLLAAIFGMNTEYLPVVGIPGDFWWITGFMLFLTLLMFFFFKRRNWL